jgi:hypothetical protein
MYLCNRVEGFAPIATTVKNAKDRILSTLPVLQRTDSTRLTRQNES